MSNRRKACGGFVLPVVVSCVLVVAVMAGGMLSYIAYASRVSGAYITRSSCRFAAQTALDMTTIQIRGAFSRYYHDYPKTWSVLAWFDAYSAQSLGSSGYACPMMQGATVNGCAVSVTVQAVTRSDASAVFQYANVTLQATATQKTPLGLTVSKTIEETVEFGMRRSSVFDHAYFVNNYGWFQTSGCTANGNIRSNGNMYLDSYSYINGNAFSAPNDELGAAGYITVSGGGTTRHLSQSSYWSSAGTWARPTNPTSSDTADTWAMGYDGTSSLYSYQETLEMPYLGDLSGYQEVAVNTGGYIKQNGKVVVNNFFNGVGPSGGASYPDAGCLILDGSSKPIEISGAVVVEGDVIIKGTVTGQGVIYAGRNIHIVGDLKYKNPPCWSKPDTNPDNTVKKNSTADILGLCAKGNIVLGNYTDSAWLSACSQYITPPFVDSYTCDVTDSSIGYGTTFSGNYTSKDSGKKVTYTLKSGQYVASGSTDRRYYESSVGDQVIKTYAQSAAISEIDAVLYNNHAIMGKVGQCQFNGAFVCRNEGCIYSTSVSFNWDSRLGSRSPDGMDFFIYLPMSIANPRVVSWREVI